MFKHTLPRYSEWPQITTYLELHQNRTAWKLDNQSVSDDVVDEFYSDLVSCACREFKRLTGVDIYLLGRSGRHVCVQDTRENSRNYQKLRKLALELEQQVIAAFNAWHPEEEEDDERN